MSGLSFVWDPQASVDVLSARARLGVVRAAELDDELGTARTRLLALPFSAPCARLRGEWSPTIRKLILPRSPYHLYYVVDEPAAQVVALALRHERAREPKLESRGRRE